MNLTGNAVFITGGASGIGLVLAAALLEMGKEVMIRGRDRDKLERAREAHPGRAVIGCDLTRDQDLEEAAEAVSRDLGRLSVLVNNAGFQHNYVFAEDPAALDRIDKENAPVHCATKAALRSFTKVLRHQLESTPVAVFEVVPPLLDSAMTTGRA